MTDNQKTALDFLSQILSAETKIREKQLEIEALEYKASGAGAIRYDKDHVQTSPQNYMEMAIADIVELQSQVDEEMTSIERMKGVAYSIIRRIEDAEQRTLLEWYYLNCCRVNEICLHMNRSERSFYYIRDEALESFGIKMDNI